MSFSRSFACLALMALAISTDAFASRARILVLGSADPFGLLGQAGHGTFFYEDNYNIFYNPSYANDQKNWAIVERSNGFADGGEGGFAFGLMNFTVGAYLNRVDAIPQGFDSTQETEMRPFDVFVAGDLGTFQWGALYTRGSLDLAAGDVAYNGFNVGFQFGELEPYVQFGFAEDETAPGVGDQDFTGYQVGLRYRWGEWLPFAAYARQEFRGGAAGNNERDGLGIGLGRNARLTEGLSLYYALSYWRGFENDINVLPFNLGLEGQITSWLIARAGLVYNIVSTTDGNSNVNTTTSAQGATSIGSFPGDDLLARFGATIRVNQVDFDWAVGGGAGGYGNLDSYAFDVSNGFFTAANLSYRW